jgi:hypothetical protein
MHLSRSPRLPATQLEAQPIDLSGPLLLMRPFAKFSPFSASEILGSDRLRRRQLPTQFHNIGGNRGGRAFLPPNRTHALGLADRAIPPPQLGTQTPTSDATVGCEQRATGGANPRFRQSAIHCPNSTPPHNQGKHVSFPFL